MEASGDRGLSHSPRPTFLAEKTIFTWSLRTTNSSASSPHFLENSETVTAFAKLPPTSRFPFSD